MFLNFTLDGSTNQCQVGDGFIRWFYPVVFIWWFYLSRLDVAESFVLYLMREEKTWNSFHRKNVKFTVPISHPKNTTQVTRTSSMLMGLVFHKGN